MNQKLIKGGHTSNKGITLIALVITIIVLLILAGVTLSMVLGDEGLIDQAQNAGETYEIKAGEEEKAYEIDAVSEIDRYINQKETESSIPGAEGTQINTPLKDALEGDTANTVKLNRKVFMQESLTVVTKGMTLDLNGQELVFTNANRRISCSGRGVNLKIIDSQVGESKTGKIVLSQSAACAYNSKYDLNKDGVVCAGDYKAVSHAIFAGYNEKFDLYSDGLIDAGDLSKILNYMQYQHIVEDGSVIKLGSDETGTGEDAPQENYLEQGCPHHRIYTDEEYYEMAINAN